jgi:two-component system, chemotaxis family, chemotaxis protein CheY
MMKDLVPGVLVMAKTVLITDDALFMRVTLKNILVSNGYEVIGEATNGQEAIEKYAIQRPDVVLMDITMPVMDGIAATRAIKNGDPTACVVMCTAMGQKNMVIEAIQAGAKDFIVKPFQPDRVLESIKKLIG